MRFVGTVTDKAGNSDARSIDIAVNTPVSFVLGIDCAGNDVRHPGGGTDDVAWSYNTIKTAMARDLGSHLKFFGGSSGIAKAQTLRNATGALEPWPLLCFEVYTPADLNAFMAANNTRCSICYKQEFTQQVRDGIITISAFNTKYHELRDIIDQHPKGNLVELQYVGAEAAERSVSTPIWPDVDVVARAALGNDTYCQQLQHLDPAKAFKASADWWAAVRNSVPGVKLRISEWGLSRVNYTPAQRIQAARDAIAFWQARGATSLNYWAVDNHSTADPGKDWGYDKAGDESVAAFFAANVSVGA